ncbi:hypothetical protein [Agreia bicolorata]|nr:hypothetical protein [Agreia bicolorata]
MNDSRARLRASRGSRMLLLGSLTLAIVAGPAPIAATAAGIDDDGVGVHVEITPRPGETPPPGEPGGSGSGSGSGVSGQLSSTGLGGLELLAATGLGIGLVGGILTLVARRGRPDGAGRRDRARRA